MRQYVGCSQSPIHDKGLEDTYGDLDIARFASFVTTPMFETCTHVIVRLTLNHALDGFRGTPLIHYVVWRTGEQCDDVKKLSE